MIQKSDLIKYYEDEGLSMKDIAEKFHCSVHKIEYWMQKYSIERRSRSEALYLKNNPDGDPFCIKDDLSDEELVLLGLGLGLWWGEGSKRHAGVIRIGNSDPLLIGKFILFLEKICGVDKQKLRFGLQIFSDINPRVAKEYWIRALNVKAEQFHPKVVVTQSGKIGTYRKKSKYGVITLYCANVKLKKAFDMLMNDFAYT